jgi:TusA-related sulfurtransferase
MKNTSKKTLAKLLALGILVGGTGAAAISQASAETISQHPPQMMGHGPDFMQNVTHTVEKIDNGVVITLTSDDADVVQKLQDREANFDANHGPVQNLENVTRSVINLDNGVQITMTSDDPDTVAQLQEGPKGGPRGGDHHLGQMEGVTRSVENIDNGVVITLTSDNPDTVAKLQEFEAHMTEMQSQQPQQ